MFGSAEVLAIFHFAGRELGSYHPYGLPSFIQKVHPLCYYSGLEGCCILVFWFLRGFVCYLGYRLSDVFLIFFFFLL